MENHLIAQSVTVGNYIGIWKIVLFLPLFFLWAWAGQWLDKDAPLVRTNRNFWNNIYLGVGALSLILWFIIPAPFIVMLLIFLIAWVTVGLTYVIHRNARVMPEDRVLTPDHIRSILARDQKSREAKQRFIFISANKNPLPMPHRQDEEYEGYRIAENLLYDIIVRRASVANLIPTGESFQVQMVIDGVAGVADDQSRVNADQAINYIKAVAGMDVKDKRKPQTGVFTLDMKGKQVDWKVRTAGSTRGEQMTLERKLEKAVIALEQLGFNEKQLEKINQMIERDSGIVLVSGTRSSGVSTSLYSIIKKHDGYIQNVHAFEMNPLTDMDNITQHIMEANIPQDQHAKQLQSVIRTDPDVVMVGFFDTPDMAKVGTQAAREGKKLYFGMEALSTFHALQDWIKKIGNPERVAKYLVGITCQRLVRKLCRQCRQAYTPDAGLLKKLNLPADKISQFYRPPTEFEYDKHGKPIVCEQCQGTGYYGLTAVFEILLINEEIQKLIAQSAPITAIRTQCRKHRMLYLQEQALRKVIDGTTSIQEVLRVTVEKPSKSHPQTGKAKPS